MMRKCGRSAFLWQAAWDSPAVAPAKPGNAAKGKDLFETRGCLACHSMGEGDEKVGGEFAANLTRLGQKANYDYIVRWIHDPRQRTRPYCPREQRDLTPEDYARATARLGSSTSTIPNVPTTAPNCRCRT